MPSALFPQFKRFVLDNNLIAKKDTIIAAVSGGVDSIVMLSLLHRLSKTYPFEIVVAHVNYDLRGKDSDRDEAAVRMLAKKLSLPFEILKWEGSKKANFQDVARKFRYDFFRDLSSKFRGSKVATAHHIEDQVETFFMHLFRGAGLKGLCGMRARAKLGDLTVIRPLLFVSKSPIKKYAKGQKLKFGEDYTNFEKKYFRNRLRHELIPLVEDLSHRSIETISDTCRRLVLDEEALDCVGVEAYKDALVNSTFDIVRINRTTFCELPVAIRYRILMKAYVKISSTTKDLNDDQLTKMDQIANSPRMEGSYRLPSSCRFSMSGDILSISKSVSKCDR